MKRGKITPAAREHDPVSQFPKRTGNQMPLHGEDRLAVIGTCNLGGVEFTLIGSLIDTVRAVDDHPRKEIVRAFVAVAGHEDLPEEARLTTDVVKGAVQLEWYRAAERSVPEEVTERQENRIMATRKGAKTTARKGAAKTTAKVAKRSIGKTPATVAAEGGAVDEAPAKGAKKAAAVKQSTPRSKGRAVWPEKKTKGAYIRHLLGEGKNDEQIMKAVDKTFTNMKRPTNAQDIKFERALIKREGL